MSDPRLTEIAQIDAAFAEATGWGSWMVMRANDRERLVNDLRKEGHKIEHKYLARATGGYPAAPPPAQCCMCGKTGLSTVEGDGGPECEFSDGRWVCSRECWDRAVQPDAAALIRWHDMLLQDFGDDLSSIVRAEMLAMLDKPGKGVMPREPTGSAEGPRNTAPAGTDDAGGGAEPTAVQPHVNETPKSEHEARDVLTPATKGGTHD